MNVSKMSAQNISKFRKVEKYSFSQGNRRKKIITIESEANERRNRITELNQKLTL
jgi:hypothetical protein